MDKPAHEIRIEEISYLSISPFNTCNLEFQYCYLSSAQRQKKITSEDTTIYSIVQKWHEAKMLDYSEKFSTNDHASIEKFLCAFLPIVLMITKCFYTRKIVYCLN